MQRGWIDSESFDEDEVYIRATTGPVADLRGSKGS